MLQLNGLTPLSNTDVLLFNETNLNDLYYMCQIDGTPELIDDSN